MFSSGLGKDEVDWPDYRSRFGSCTHVVHLCFWPLSTLHICHVIKKKAKWYQLHILSFIL